MEYQEDKIKPPAAPAPQTDRRPVMVLKVGDFEFIKWPAREGMKESHQVVKNTYNPKQQKYMRQHISISNYGDAVQLKRLLELIDEKRLQWVKP